MSCLLALTQVESSARLVDALQQMTLYLAYPPPANLKRVIPVCSLRLQAGQCDTSVLLSQSDMAVLMIVQNVSLPPATIPQYELLLHGAFASRGTAPME